MFDIRKPLPCSFEYENHIYRLNLSFNNILDIFDMFRDKILTDYEKYEFAAVMLTDDSRKMPVAALNMIFEEYISIGRNSGNRTGLKTFDFEQDSIYIYSSFMADYGIDLFEQQNKMHWWKFISLFQGLSDGTKMHEVLSIRQREIPEPNKYNSQEIRRLHELKAYYALDISQEEREENFRNGIKNLADILKARAKGR
ncbi:MAG TPA: hypothetical protein DD392_08030 [Ruminococcus sp.]|nr:hypothetical protein [Ruminococcus sp.]